MTRAVVQMGHVGSSKWGPGAPYEEEHIKMVVPHIVSRLQRGGVQVDVFGGDMPYGMTHDMFMSVHCDSDGGAFRWSMGFRDDTHPGSSAYAHAIYPYYAALAPGPYSENITPGEHHYYGFSHFVAATKCALIELQFVSNARGRQWIASQPDKLGYAIADGMLAYAGKHVEEVDMGFDSTRQHFGRTQLAEDHAFIGQNNRVVEDCWLHFTAFEEGTTVNVMVFNDDIIKQTKEGTKNPPYVLHLNKYQEVSIAGFGIAGPVTWRAWSDKQVLLSADYRMSW